MTPTTMKMIQWIGGPRAMSSTNTTRTELSSWTHPWWKNDAVVVEGIIESPPRVVEVAPSMVKGWRRDTMTTTMATGDDDNDDKDGATLRTTTTTAMMVTARRTKGYNSKGGGRRIQGRWQRCDGR